MDRAQIDQTLPPFDELVALAENDPAAFEEYRRQMCEEMITCASQEMQPRLWAQQSHIERVITKCKNPVHTNVTLMNELSVQMGKFRDALDGDNDAQPTAQILPFTARQ
ncbi:DUF3135 domain-containing protein [Vibrio tapetis]|uniref:DUF3135 domain-containing protein n=1 Tax=Vibrio tapetis subsp. tapetis TaxID=1671868 RepID=A0A2N8ZG08_9VIBR|nr:DUF3135 domain-containing protein [Vibrio tapetis]MDN3678956.1 DUF3135 domain-containing protein [Vibrio tapetis subsp. quintayensis]SON50833.1 conserved protein of unknown function [Vibrio tapetis subsp. tapetis]